MEPKISATGEIIAARRPIVLSVGTTDPWAAAGVQLDLFIADRLSVRLVNCIVAVSAQDGRGAFSITSVPSAMVRAQLAALEGADIAAMRIGAIRSAGHVDELLRFIESRPMPVVLDPVIATSSGGRFIDDDVINAMRSKLFPHLTLLTPNLDEAEILLQASVRTLGEMDAAALKLAAMGPKAVLVKGGHLAGIPTDVLWDGEQLRHMEAPRLPHDMRGTGCVLAMTFAAALTYGHSIRQAAKVSRDVVRILIQASRPIGHMYIAP